MENNIKILLNELENYFEEQEEILNKIAEKEDSIENNTEKHIKDYHKREIRELYEDLYNLDYDMNMLYRELSK